MHIYRITDLAERLRLHGWEVLGEKESSNSILLRPEDKQAVYGNVPQIVVENLPTDKDDQIYSVTMTWYMKSERKWTHPCIIYYLKIEDGDLERVSRIIAKDYGNLEEGWLQIKDGMARFGIESDTFYRFTISPIIVRDI